ncbi:hypothetical protein DFJ73DRAFT_804171 [Zopfochytrium polystomum]|nr:hypothetical protein DFJ73DRAFT_804171 [Zopfochytrium polystomum]
MATPIRKTPPPAPPVFNIQAIIPDHGDVPNLPNLLAPENDDISQLTAGVVDTFDRLQPWVFPTLIQKIIGGPGEQLPAGTAAHYYYALWIFQHCWRLHQSQITIWNDCEAACWHAAATIEYLATAKPEDQKSKHLRKDAKDFADRRLKASNQDPLKVEKVKEVTTTYTPRPRPLGDALMAATVVVLVVVVLPLESYTEAFNSDLSTSALCWSSMEDNPIMSTPTPQQLPPREILSEIAGRPRHADLLCFRRACRLFAQVADPLAFAAIEIAIPVKTGLDSFGRHVRRLDLTTTHSYANPKPDHRFVASKDPVVAEWVRHLTTVESIHCKFGYSFGRAGIPTLLQVLNELPAPSKVETIRLEPYTEAFKSDLRLDSAMIRHIKRFPNLRHVVLGNVSDFDHVAEVAKTWPGLESLQCRRNRKIMSAQIHSTTASSSRASGG